MGGLEPNTPRYSPQFSEGLYYLLSLDRSSCWGMGWVLVSLVICLDTLVFSSASYSMVVGASCHRALCWRVGWLQFSMLSSWVRLRVAQVGIMVTLLFSSALFSYGVGVGSSWGRQWRLLHHICA